MGPTEYLRALCDIEGAETVDDLRRVLARLERRLDRRLERTGAGQLRDADERTRRVLARLDERACDLAAIETLLAGLG